MPATIDYLANLKTQLETASQNKRQALQNQYDRATGAQFNKDTGALTYRTDASGNPLYGTLDVDYMEQQRGINTQAEGAGMLRSGQRARNLATSEAGYRATVGGLAESLAAGQTGIDDDQALRIAEYEAMYGSPSGGGSGGSASATKPAGSTNLPPIKPVPTGPTGPTEPTRTSTNKPPLPKTTRRYVPYKPPLKGPVQGPSLQGAGKFTPPKPPLPKTTRRYVPYKPPLPKTTRR
jgi:hypothetical protein